MIAKLIDACIRNRFMVLLLTAMLIAAGVWSARHMTVDAIPDLSDVQVIIRTEYAGQAPRIVEDQVTYPLTTAMLAVPRAKVVRGYSMFGSSFVYIIFEDGTDMYWARSRVLEQLSVVSERLPGSAVAQLGPDATGVGWVYEYVLTTEPNADVDLSQLRSIQDWFLRYELTAVEGVSEVASIGGFVRQYQVVVDPVRLQAYGLSLSQVKRAIQRSNQDVGGRVMEMSETEFMVRGIGYLGSGGDDVVDQIDQIALGATGEGLPIYLRDVADVRVGPEIRRGISEWNGEGETVGGIVIMRYGENARDTIARVRDKLDQLQASLPPGVRIATAYDRSDLIDRAVGTLTHTLFEEILVVSIITILFLLHLRSSLVAIFVLPTGVLASLVIMHVAGINANIMSLGGIAIAIGVMVDSSVIMVENAHKHIEREKQRTNPRPHALVIAEAAKEVGPSLFFSLLIITVSFLPVFALGEQSGRMFRPLAFTKTFAMATAAVLAVTVIPVLMSLFIRGHIISEQRNPISWLLIRIYEPLFSIALKLRWLAILAAIVVVMITAVPLFGLANMPWLGAPLAAKFPRVAAMFPGLGREFMPPLEEGDLLYMPTTDPGLSVTKARELLQQTDRLIMQFPEVEAAFGKIGRADTATDPAPLTMIETTITLHRDKDKWRTIAVERFYDDWPDALAWLPRKIWPKRRTITSREIVYGYELPNGQHVPGMNDALQIPGLTNAWTMPIRTRIDMLSTGIRTPVGVKVMGDDLQTLAALSGQVEQLLRTDASTARYTASAFADKTTGGHYLDINIDRDAIARYGLTVGDVQDVIMSALGGMNVSFTVEGRQRYPINVRYPRELRDNVPKLKRILVDTPAGAQVPLGQLVTIERTAGAPMIKSENARLTSWVFVDIRDIDVGTYVDHAKRVVNERIDLPAGYNIVWSGQYEYMQAARARLMVLVPLTFVIIIVLLYVATRSWLRVAIVLLAVPFSAVGAVWLLWMLDYNLSLAVWVGVIALAGLDAETGLVMLLYLDTSYERFVTEGKMRDKADLWAAVHDGAVQRIRPKTMTVVTTFMGLLPLMWASGAGADTMRRLAAPMIGGLATSFAMELLVYPAIYFIARRIQLKDIDN